MADEKGTAKPMMARAWKENAEKRKTLKFVAALAVLYMLVLIVQAVGSASQRLAEKSVSPASVASRGSNLLIASTAGVDGNLNLSTVELAQEHCLAQAIYYEARGEDVAGQIAVSEVVLNRVSSKRYPNSICGVVFQNEQFKDRCQFSFACDGKSDNPPQGVSWTRSRLLAQYQFRDPGVDLTDAATHYHADYVSPSWATRLHKTVKIGRHVFYRPVSST